MAHLSKKAQKKAQIKRNRFQQEIFNALRLRRAEEDRVRQNEGKKKTKQPETKKEESWSAKTATIRNRLTDKKRVSRERWNRFSGTDAAGARGL
jgi:hypothetical protein